MKFFKISIFCLILSSSLSLMAMDKIYDLLNNKRNEPTVKFVGVASLLKLAAIEKQCDDLTYFKENYAVFKDELREYQTAWMFRKDSLIDRSQVLLFGSLQIMVGLLCFAVIDKKHIDDPKSQLPNTIIALSGMNLCYHGYKNLKELYQWKIVAQEKISNAENALKKLEEYKETLEVR